MSGLVSAIRGYIKNILLLICCGNPVNGYNITASKYQILKFFTSIEEKKYLFK